MLMKLMIASDIHGSAKFCRELLSALDTEGADKLILLGDILYHGPRNDLPDGYAPKEVISLLREKHGKILSVRGNCEAEVDQMVLDFPVLSDYALIFADGFELFATHGHIYNEDSLPPLGEGAVLLNGHTHVSKFVDHGSYVYANPGSVSIPKEGTPRGYIIFEDGTLVWKTLDGAEYMRHTVKKA